MKIFYLSLSFFFLSFPAHAFLNSRISSNIQSLEQSYKNGDISQSVIYLWDVLAEDPYDKTGAEYLQKFLQSKSLSSMDRLRLISVRDILDQIRNLSRRRDHETQRIADEKAYFKRAGVTTEDLDIFIDRFVSDRMQEVSAEISGVFFEGEAQWKEIFGRLSSEKLLLEKELKRLELERMALNGFADHLRIASKASTPETVARIDIQPDQRNVSSPAEVEDIRVLLADLQDKVTMLETDVAEKSVLIESLRRQVVDLNLSLVQRDNLLQQRMAELDDFRQRMDDVQSRFILGQKIIQEKDIQLAAFERELDFSKNLNRELHEKMEEQIAIKDREISGLSEFLDIYREKFQDISAVVDRKNEVIAVLFKSLSGVQAILDQKEEGLRDLQRNLDDMGNQLDLVKLQVATAEDFESGEQSAQEVFDLEMRLQGVKDYLMTQMEENVRLNDYLSEEQKRAQESPVGDLFGSEERLP